MKSAKENNKKKMRSKRKQKKNKVPQEGFQVDDFKYDKEKDIYICPEGEKLERIYINPGTEKSGRKTITYACKKCDECKSKGICTNNKRGRSISISINREEINNFYNSMENEGSKQILGKRKEIVEHPFGTIKRNLGFSYFMQRGIEKVKAEFSFMCFIYNLKRVLNLVPMNRLIMALNV